MTDNLQQRIESKTVRMAVIGLGTIGLPLSVEFALAAAGDIHRTAPQGRHEVPHGRRRLGMGGAPRG